MSFPCGRRTEGLTALENNNVMTRSRKEQSMCGHSHNLHVEILPVPEFDGMTHHRPSPSVVEHRIMRCCDFHLFLSMKQ